MCEDISEIEVSKKSWTRTIEPVTKIGYMDGASDGQTAVFQQSFNVGYEQGISFGMELGFLKAMDTLSILQRTQLQDQQRINCQICTSGVKAQENIGNLYNVQKEQNTFFFNSD